MKEEEDNRVEVLKESIDFWISVSRKKDSEIQSLKSQLKQREEQLTDINATWNKDLNEIKKLKEALRKVIDIMDGKLDDYFLDRDDFIEIDKAKKLL
jgi:chromosome segregation ATPase